jgi:hypothetical protein
MRKIQVLELHAATSHVTARKLWVGGGIAGATDLRGQDSAGKGSGAKKT